MVPTDSYYKDMYTQKGRYFDVIGLSVQFVIDKELVYSDNAVQTEIESLMESIWSDECFINESSWTTSWILDYNNYLDVNYGGDVNQSAFYHILFDEWLLSDEGEGFTQDIWSSVVLEDGESVDRDNYGSIRRSRFKVTAVPSLKHTSQVSDCLENYHRIQEQYEDSLGLLFDLSVLEVVGKLLNNKMWL